jgi:hypothetical protein
MINYAASITQTDNHEKNSFIYPIESLYSQVLINKQNQNNVYTNDKADQIISDLLRK